MLTDLTNNLQVPKHAHRNNSGSGRKFRIHNTGCHPTVLSCFDNQVFWLILSGSERKNNWANVTLVKQRVFPVVPDCSPPPKKKKNTLRSGVPDVPCRSADWVIFVLQDLTDKVGTREVIRVLGDELRARLVDLTNCLTQVISSSNNNSSACHGGMVVVEGVRYSRLEF